MPSESEAQHNFMEMIAHNQAAAKRAGVPQGVAKEFVAADKRKGKKALRRLPKHKGKKHG